MTSDATRPEPTAGDFQPLVVERLVWDTDTSLQITFRRPADDAGGWQFAHGQHLVLRHQVDGRELRRCYSLCSPAPDGPLRVAVRRVEGGAFSGWVHDTLQVGQEIDVMPPRGAFTHSLASDAARRYLLVAGGSGITPIYSVARTVLEQEPEAEVTLLYVNRSVASTMLLDDLEALRNLHLERFRVWHAFTEERAQLELLSGRPDAPRLEELIARGFLPERPDHVFLCGPQGLVETAREVLRAPVVSPRSCIHTELFMAERRARRGAPAQEPGRAACRVEARLHGRSTSVDLAAGQTILEAVERARPEVPFSCRAGVCSTCLARLIEGEVEMETDHVLSPVERESGLVLTCQARPKTERIVVDYDI